MLHALSQTYHLVALRATRFDWFFSAMTQDAVVVVIDVVVFSFIRITYTSSWHHVHLVLTSRSSQPAWSVHINSQTLPHIRAGTHERTHAHTMQMVHIKIPLITEHRVYCGMYRWLKHDVLFKQTFYLLAVHCLDWR